MRAYLPAAITVGVALAAAVAGQAIAQDFGVCAVRADPAAQITACTAIVEDATATDEFRAAALLYRCQAKEGQGELEDALADCRQSMTLREADAAVHNSMRGILRQLGRYPEALASATRAVDLAPENAGFRNGRANVHCAIGNLESAYQDRLIALEMGRFTVKGLQEALKSRGHYKGRIDGIFGPKSKTALRAWTQAGCK